MADDELRRILDQKWAAYTDMVVAAIRALPKECLQSGDDSRLADVWEEFKTQIQGEESGVFEAYVETIQAICREHVLQLPNHELELLWRDSDAFLEYDDEWGPPDRGELIEGVQEQVYEKIVRRAADEDVDETSAEGPDDTFAQQLGCENADRMFDEILGPTSPPSPTTIKSPAVRYAIEYRQWVPTVSDLFFRVDTEWPQRIEESLAILTSFEVELTEFMTTLNLSKVPEDMMVLIRDRTT